MAAGKLPCDTGSSAGSPAMTERAGMAVGGRQAQEGGCVDIHRTDLLHCTAET